MSFATDKWFQHIRGELLTEGLADIGLDEMIQREIEAKMPEASEKGRMWVGTAWKSLDGNRISNYSWFEGYLINALAQHIPTFKREDNNILLDLISVYTTQPVGKWPKAKRKFARNSLRFKAPNRETSQVILDLKVLEQRTWNWFSSRIENVITTLNQNPNNYDMIKTIPPSDYTAAEEVCFDYQQTREDPEQVINTFEDGSYWYDLDTYQCEMEGNRMGHCGTDQRGTLYSLRKKDPGKKASKSYITIAYNADERTIYQIKGRQNTCPPQELWRHIATFIEIMGAEKLEETGEYSNEPEEFEELGQWLDENTSISFEGSIEKRMEEFRQEVERLENDWERSEYFQQVDFDGVSIDTLDYDENVVPTWAASVSSIASKLPFDLTEEAMRTLLAVGSEDSADLALADEIEEAIMEIFKEEDRNDIIRDAHHYSQAYAYLLRADNYAQAFIKADNMSRLMSEDREQLTKGSDTYVVIWDIGRLFEDYAADNFDNTDADGFEEWYKAVNEMVDDLDDSLDAIEDLLVSRKLIGANQIKAFKAKMDEEFNNFAVATTRTRKGEYDIMATGLLFKTTAAEMETIVDLGFLNDFYSTRSGYYTSEQFKTYVITKLKQKEAQAVQFAKNQMKLNFGEKYEEKIESLWDKINSSDTIKKSFYNQIFVGFQPSVPKKLSNPRPTQTVERDSAFGYKIEVILNNQTIEFFGPFLEYYDNNFELVTGAIDYALKTMISAKAKKYKTQSGNDTNLPTQEGLITEGLADIGLPDDLVGLIMEFLPTASEKGRVWVGNAFKVYAILGPARDRMLAELITLVDEHYKLFQFGDNPEANPFLNLDRALRTGNIKQVIKARKSFVKAASKLGADQTITDKILRLVDRGLQGTLKFFLKERINSVVTTLNQNPNNYEMIKDFPDWDWSEANEAMEEYQAKIETPDQIIHRFDDGSYWYDLKTSRCKNEGERMGHCGMGMYGSLYSLRKKDKGKKESRSYVTISYNPEDKTIYQIKGRGNDAPLEQFWKHIAEFVNLTGAAHNDELGEHSKSKESFEKLANYLTQETGITSDLEGDSLPEAKEELRVACNEKLQKFNEVYGENTPAHRLLVGGEMVGHQPRVFWQQETDMIAIELPFKPSKEQLIWSGGDLTPDEQVILELIKITDSSELLSTKNPNLGISFVAAGDASRAIRVLGAGRSARIDSAKKADSRFWMIVDGLNPSFVDFINSAVILNPEVSRESAEGYANFLKRLGMLIETMKKAVAGPIKDQLAKWDAEDQGESLQEAGNPLDVRLYEIDYVMSYPLGQGFEITDIHNIIRAIPDVTTVRTIGNAKRSQGNRTISLQRLKFALQGQKNRAEWVKQVLLPQIHKISGKIRIHKVERAELVSSSKQRLEESYFNSTMRQSPGRTTPVPSIQGLIDDWVDGGVMYDQPTNHDLTRYSVMMPVSDLEHLCGREARKHGDHFDAGYQNFIQNGPRDPIYLAIGKNGRAKITGNEDDLRYAIKAGVEEVPVFISYQRQV
jgi:hypothetical protein